MERAIGIVVGLMAFEFAGRTALHLSIFAALFGRIVH
jgi:hypothetical protein